MRGNDPPGAGAAEAPPVAGESEGKHKRGRGREAFRSLARPEGLPAGPPRSPPPPAERSAQSPPASGCPVPTLQSFSDAPTQRAWTIASPRGEEKRACPHPRPARPIPTGVCARGGRGTRARPLHLSARRTSCPSLRPPWAKVPTTTTFVPGRGAKPLGGSLRRRDADTQQLSGRLEGRARAAQAAPYLRRVLVGGEAWGLGGGVQRENLRYQDTKTALKLI
ncbi:proline-rich protein 2-like [Mustela lutreola]|uniref:proline-rich protein 2-like n=1 Tax=Mustela lutreola TaxID=9666 RepID=UPI0027976E81|nr:proline-rich protein 2-like [Mustela lutreola]XP_059042394.1 proline-rich protein 2-like [Mustela lutreola]XP_059042395.1 proline-rich protein 2-like [Mustela lutreola]XP_059042396.1 proline-rich protein 2-like [Mustela lutreola]